MPSEPTLSSADKAEEGAASAILLPVPPLALPPRGVMARCCFSRICLILAARREAVEAFEDMLLLLLVYAAQLQRYLTTTSQHRQGG